MAIEELVLIISRLSLGAVAAFLAIIVWSNTRDAAWMFVVIGIIIKYCEIMYATLGIFGIIPADVYIFPGILTVNTVLVNLPFVFYITAFIILISRTKVR